MISRKVEERFKYIEFTGTLFKLVRTEREIRTRLGTFDKLTRTSASDF